ncbi:dephospho-CoA kinase [Anticarsia gemmatalis]|uniref:dephospho-CoA kinase n=1 Tax=Anticarsia gemmatalis TaxID=129554 RepID=UPI003F765F3A
MFIVGLTGGLASGKSTVLSVFRENGIPVVDADEVAMEVLAPGTSGCRALVDAFGDEVLQPTGIVNRTVLGELIFDNYEKRQTLNSITFPRIQRAMIKRALWHLLMGHRYIVMEVPLLFESGNMLGFFHKIITVSCDYEQQLERLMKRNDLLIEAARIRIECQLPLEYKIQRSNFIVDNSGDVETTRRQAESIIRLLERSKFTLYFRAMVLVSFISIVFGFGYVVNNMIASGN